MKRASIEPNFHTLYANFVDAINLPKLTTLVTRETFRNIRVRIRWEIVYFNVFFFVLVCAYIDHVIRCISFKDAQVILIIIPHQRSCRGYNVFDPSVSASAVSQLFSQYVSPVFRVSATPLKPLNRISWNFVVMKDIMCRWAYLQEILIQFFFSE